MLDADMAKQGRTSWCNRTGWPEYLARCNLKHLVAAAALPMWYKRSLQRVRKMVDVLIEQSVPELSSLGLESKRGLRSVKWEEAD